MLNLVLAGTFVVGFLVGAWRAFPTSRRPLAVAAMVPLLLLLTTGFFTTYIWLTADPSNEMYDLAIVATTVVGVEAALLALVGGLLGLWLQRRRKERR